jgi:hypothetical protein
VNTKAFFIATLTSAIDLGLATGDDILRYVTPEILGAHLPRPLWARLLTACVGASGVDAQLVLETVGIPNLCEHVPTALVWRCLADIGARVVGGEDAPSYRPPVTVVAPAPTAPTMAAPTPQRRRRRHRRRPRCSRPRRHRLHRPGSRPRRKPRCRWSPRRSRRRRARCRWSISSPRWRPKSARCPAWRARARRHRSAFARAATPASGGRRRRPAGPGIRAAR